jgi:hypothetical protein
MKGSFFKKIHAVVSDDAAGSGWKTFALWNPRRAKTKINHVFSICQRFCLYSFRKFIAESPAACRGEFHVCPDFHFSDEFGMFKIPRLGAMILRTVGFDQHLRVRP